MKHSPFLPICLALIASAAANCQVATPSIGYVRYPGDGIRGVYGLEGNYVVGGSVLAPAEASSFSDEGGLIFNSGSLYLVDPKLTTLASAEIEDSGAIVRAGGSLTTAIAWLPSSSVLVHWSGRSFVRISVAGLSGQDAITSVQKLDLNTASLLASKPDGTVVRYLISLQTGEFKNSTIVPGASGFAFEVGNRILCFKEQKLSVLSQTGDTLQVLALPLETGLVIEQVSSRCLHLSTKAPGQDWVLHLDGGNFRLYRLPAPRTISVSASGAKSESAQ